MFIEKTTLIEFDEVTERARIENVFKGQRQQKLLTVLELFVAGQWDDLVTAMRALSKEELEFVAEPVFDIAKECALRTNRLQAFAAGYAPETELHQQQRLFGAEALGSEGVAYPKFVLKTAEELAPASSPSIEVRG